MLFLSECCPELALVTPGVQHHWQLAKLQSSRNVLRIYVHTALRYVCFTFSSCQLAAVGVPGKLALMSSE